MSSAPDDAASASNGEASKKRDTPFKTSLRDVTKDNIGQLKTLNRAVFPVTYRSKYYESVRSNPRYARLLYHLGSLVGAIACRVEDAKEDAIASHPELEGRKRLYVMTLGVLVPYRGYGCGSKLVREMIQRAEEDEEVYDIFLHVQVDNDDALEFYDKFGFEVDGRVENYYKRLTPPDCFVLRKVVSSSASAAAAPKPEE